MQDVSRDFSAFIHSQIDSGQTFAGKVLVISPEALVVLVADFPSNIFFSQKKQKGFARFTRPAVLPGGKSLVKIDIYKSGNIATEGNEQGHFALIERGDLAQFISEPSSRGEMRPVDGSKVSKYLLEMAETRGIKVEGKTADQLLKELEMLPV